MENILRVSSIRRRRLLITVSLYRIYELIISLAFPLRLPDPDKPARVGDVRRCAEIIFWKMISFTLLYTSELRLAANGVITGFTSWLSPQSTTIALAPFVPAKVCFISWLNCSLASSPGLLGMVMMTEGVNPLCIELR